ncbi:MAG TPA: secondary thiamine-phosphate synthase enzyme YjbQ [Methanobacterium sp.]|nr:MAG: YjbQ family protein [Methanobacterium sp.]HOI71156.1 secondary thiamine-phosphate synthase enzyme YjbQ [Methanobacterium sp.]HPX77547.1 secondary thiamine-phosphate synthase enzyme YjbQ [Methanobacterium sp.]
MLTEIMELKTNNRVEIIDITRSVDAALAESRLRKGLVNIYSKHSTSAIFINENESGLLEDYLNLIDKLVPTDDNYRHDQIDNNADSHLRSFIIGNNETVPFENGSMDLGTWQSVFFLDMDGPRNRKITITIMGE